MKAFGLGLSVMASGNLGLIFNAPCASDIAGESFGIDLEALKDLGGGISGGIGSAGAISVVGSGGIGEGASGTFSICKAFPLSCN